MAEDVWGPRVLVNNDPDEESREESKSLVQEEKKQETWRPRLLKSEEQAEREGSLQFSTGVVRVSDAPSYDDPLSASGAVRGDEFGISRGETLKGMVGLGRDERFTDYYARNGFIPEGFEMDAKMLMHQEKKREYEQLWMSKEIGYNDFLFEAYGRGLLKAEGHDLGSSLYWYNRRKQGMYDSPLDNMTFLANVLEQAEALYQAETWHEESWSRTFDESLLSVVTGEKLDGQTFRELFPEYMEAMDGVIDSSEEMIRLYQAGVLEGFDPTLDTTGDGLIDKYMHTDGVLYDVVKAGEQTGNNQAIAYYNEDGSLNRIVVPGFLGEYADSFIKGFTNILTAGVQLIGYAGALIGDLGQGVLGKGWNTDTVRDFYLWSEGWKSEQGWLQNRVYSTTSGFRDQAGNIDTAAIGRGVASGTGTILGMLATAKIGGILGAKGKAMTYGAKKVGIKAMAAKQRAAGQKMAKRSVKRSVAEFAGVSVKNKAATVAGYGLKTIGGSMSSLTGLSNGMPILPKFAMTNTQATIQGLSFLALRDFTTSVGSLSARSAFHDLSDGDIIARAAGMSALNFGVSYYTRSILDKAAFSRLAEHKVAKLASKRAISQQRVTQMIRDGQINAPFVRMVDHAVRHHPRKFMMTSAGMDVMENLFTMATHTSLIQSGKIWDAEAVKTLWNPQTLASQIYIGMVTYKGGLARNAEGLETGGQLYNIRNLRTLETQYKQWINEQIQRNPESRPHWEAVRSDFDNTVARAKNPIKGMTDAFAKAHEGLFKDGKSPVQDLVTKYLNTTARQEVLAGADRAIEYYNSLKKAMDVSEQDILTGKFGRWYNFRKRHIMEQTEEIIPNQLRQAARNELFDARDARFLSEEAESLIPQRSEETLQRMIAEKRLEILSMNTEFEIKEDWDGTGPKWNAHSGFDRLSNEEQTTLLNRAQELGLTRAMLEDGVIIRVNGAGSEFESSEEYNDMIRGLQFFNRVAELETRDTDGVQLIYSLGNKKDSAFFIPYYNRALNMGLTAHLGYAMKAIMALRHAGSSEEYRNALEGLTRIISGYADGDEVDPGAKLSMLALLLGDPGKTNNVLTFEQAVRVLDSGMLDAYKKGIYAYDDISPEILTRLMSYYDARENTLKLVELFKNKSFEKKQGKTQMRNLISEIQKIDKGIRDEVFKALGVRENFLTDVGEALASPQHRSQEKLRALGRNPNLIYGENDEVSPDLLGKFLAEKLGVTREVELEERTRVGSYLDRVEKLNIPKQAKTLIKNILSSDLSLIDVTAKQVRELQVKANEGIYSENITNTVLNQLRRMKGELVLKAFVSSADHVIRSTNPDTPKGQGYLRALNFYVDRFLDLTKANSDVQKAFVDGLGREMTEKELRQSMIRPRDFDEVRVFDPLTGKELRGQTVRDFVIQNVLDNDANLRSKIPSERVSHDTIVRALGNAMNLELGTEEVKGNSILFINLAEVEGRMHRKLVESVYRYPDRINIARDKETLTQQIKVLFPGENTEYVMRSLADEQRAVAALRKQHPDGIISIEVNKENPDNISRVSRYLNQLGYDYFDLDDSLLNSVPGMYLKQGTDLAVPLRFDNAQQKQSFLDTLQTKMRLEYVEQAKKNLANVDYIKGMEEMFGGLYYLDDDTVVNPKDFVFTDLGEVSAESTGLFRAIQNITGVDVKGAKLGGLNTSLVQQAFAGVGVTGSRDNTFYRAQFILDVIDKLDIYEREVDTDAKYTIYQNLTDEEANHFRTNPHLKKMYSLSEAKQTETGTEYRIEIQPNFKRNALRYVNQSFNDHGQIEMKYILPLGHYRDANNKTLYGDKEYGINLLGTTPGAHVRYELQRMYSEKEFQNLMLQPIRMNVKFLTTGERETVLKKLQNATVRDIRENNVGLTETEFNSVEVQMMLRVFEGGQSISRSIRERAMTKQFDLGFFKRVGDPHIRKIIGDGLQRGASDDEIIQAIKDFKPQEFRQHEAAYVGRDVLADDEGYIDNNMVARLEGRNSYTLPDDDTLRGEIGLIRDAFENIYLPNSREVGLVKENIYSKLFSMLQSAGSEDTDLNLYLSYLYRLSPEEQQQAVNILRDFADEMMGSDYSKLNIDLLENKMNTLNTSSDLYSGINQRRGELVTTRRLISEDMSNVGQELATDGTIRSGQDQSNFNQLLENSINRAQKAIDINTRVKLGDLNQLDGSQRLMMEALGEALNQKLNVNNFGSATIANLNLNDMLNQTVSGIFRMANTLARDNFGIDGFKISPERALDLAWEIYIHSSGVDYSREWTKYLIYDTKTQDVHSTAQFIADGNGLNNMFYKLSDLLGANYEPDRYVLMTLDKNMMVDNRMAGTDRLSMIPISGSERDIDGQVIRPGTRERLTELLFLNGLDQYDPEIHRDVARDASDWDKVRTVYAWSVSRDDIIQNMTKRFEAIDGLDPRLARALMMTIDDVDVAKPQHKQLDQAIMNAFSLSSGFSKDEKRLVNLQQQRLNNILRYNIDWSILPEDIKVEISRQATQFRLANEQQLKKYNIPEIGSAYIRGNQAELERALNSARLHVLSDSEKNQMFDLLTDYLVLNSRDGKSLNMLLTGGRLENVLKRASEPHELTLRTVNNEEVRDSQGNVRTHNTFFKDGAYVQDVEAFYRTENGKEEAFIFQHAINEYDAVTDYKGHIDNRGDSTQAVKRYNTFIPVYYKGELIRTEEQIKAIFPEFYQQYYGPDSAAKHYLDWINSPTTKVIPEADIPGYLSRRLQGQIKGDRPILTFNGEGYDLRRLSESKLLNPDDPLLKNGFDLYERVVKEIPVNFSTEGRKRKLEMYAAELLGQSRVERAHDASVDVDNTFEVAIELFNRIQDVNRMSLGELDELREVAKLIHGRDFTNEEVARLKSNYTSSIDKQNLTPESLKYVEDYNRLYESSSEQKAALTRLYKQTLEDFEDILYRQEFDVQRRKNRDHANHVLGQHRDFYEKLARGHDRVIGKEMLYILQKIYNEGRFTTEADIEKLFTEPDMLKPLVEVFKTAAGLEGKNVMSDADWIRVLNMDPEDLLTRVAELRPDLDISYDDFASREINDAVLRSFSSRYVQSEDYQRAVRENEINTLAYKSSFKFAPVFSNILSGTGSSFADRILQREFATFYDRLTPDSVRQKREHKKTLYLRNGLTEHQKEMLKNPPVKTIRVESLYELIQPSTRFNTVKQNGKDIHMRNDTFYMNRQIFKNFFGDVTFEEAKRNAGVPEGGDLYVPVLRHPLTTVGSVHLYRVETIDDGQGIRAAMSVDTIKALHQGDVDGDHVSILRPSAHMQAFAKDVDPLLKSSYRMLDTILDNRDGKLTMLDSFEIDQYMRYSKLLSKTVVEDRLNIMAGNKSYDALKQERLNQLMAQDRSLSLDKAEEILKHTWLQQKDVRNFMGSRDFIYFTNNRFVQDTENSYMKKLFANAQAMNKELFLKFDQLTGESQKEFLKISETAQGRANNIFNYTSIDLTDTTMAIIDRNIDTVRTRLSDAISKDTVLKTEIKNNLVNLTNQAQDSTDILRSLQAYEREIFDSERFNRTTIDAIERMNNLKADDLNEYDRAYDQALLNHRDYLANTSEKKSYFDAEFSRADVIKAFDEMEDNLYFSNLDGHKISEEILAQRLHEIETNTTEYHKTLDKIDGYSDYVKTKTMFILKGMDGVHIEPDAVIRTANMNNIKNVKAYTIKLDQQDYVLRTDLKEGDVIRAGERLSAHRPALDVDIKIARIDGPDQISFIVQHDVDGRVKGTFAGSSVNKHVAQETVDNARFKELFGREMEDIDMVASSDAFDPKKFTSILGDQMSDFKYFDAQHREIKNPKKFSDAVYAIVESPFVITENTALFRDGFKESFLDEAAIGNNIRSLEGLVLLGDRYINVVRDSDGNPTISLDTRTVAEAERALQQLRTPDMASHNAARIYNLSRLSVLLKHAPISDKARINIMEDAVTLKGAGGAAGQALIQRIWQDYYVANGIKFNDLVENFNSWEKALFSERVASLFKEDSTSTIRGEKAIDIKSKSSHHLDIAADADTVKKAYRPEGFGLNHDNMIRHNGKLIHDHTESFASMNDFHRMLFDEYNLYKGPNEASVLPLSRYELERGTALNLFNTSKGFSGHMQQGFKTINALDASELTNTTDVQSLARTFKKTGDTPTNITRSFKNDFAGHPLRELESRNNRHDVSSEDIHTDYYRKLFERTHHQDMDGKYVFGAKNPEDTLRTNENRMKQFLGGSLAPTKTALGKAALHGRGEKQVTIPLAPKVIRAGEDGELKITLENKNIHASIDNWKDELFKEFGSHRFYDNRAMKSEELRDTFDPIIREARFERKDLENNESFRFSDDSDEYFEDRRTSKASELYQKEFRERHNPIVDIDKAQEIVTKELVFGREENMDRTYKTNLLESGGLKIESTGDIQLDRLIVAMVKEPKAFEMNLNRFYLELFNMAEMRGATEELNKFAYIENVLDRLNTLNRSLKEKRVGKDHINDIKYSIDFYEKSLFEELGLENMEQVRTYLRNFRSDYAGVVKQYERLNTILNKYSELYSKLTDEAFDDTYGIIVPNENKDHKANTRATRSYYRTKMFGLNRPTQKEGAAFNAYNYLDGTIEKIRAISKVAGTYNGSMRLKEMGYMDNTIIRDVITKNLEMFRESFFEIEGNARGIEKENFETFRAEVEYLVQDVDPHVRDRSSKLFDAGRFGEAYMTLFEGLKQVIDSRGMSLSEVQAQYRTTDDGQVRDQMKELMNAYTLQNDIIAILTMKSGRGTINSIYDALVREADRRGYALTDQYGRLLRAEVDDMRMLGPGSTEVIKRALRYHLSQNGGFKANVVMEAIEGDIFMMPRKLAEHMDKYIHTNKVHKGFKKALLVTQRLATKLIMSSVPRLPDRMGLFTAFDMTMGTLMNPKTKTKLPQAYRELSAFMQSKGAVMNGDIEEFLNVMGIDPNKSSYNILFNRGEQYEKEGTVLKGYFDIAGKSLSFQHLLGRYAMWLQSKEDLKKGKNRFGAAYHRKDLIRDIQARTDADGNELVSREGEQAGFLVSQQIGAFNDFPMLSKSLNGWAMFTTFPLALVRWGVGETKSLHAASKAAFLEGDTDAMRYLGVQGLGILGIYLTTNMLLQLITGAMDLDEETEEEEWIHRQAFPEIVKSIVQGQPVMNTFSSHNPVRVLEDLTTGQFRDAWRESEGDLGYTVKEGATQWFLNNVASRGNPAARTAAELMGGTDMIGGTFIDNSDRYSFWENFARKMGAFFIGGAGANAAMRQYNQAKYDDDNNAAYHLMEGIRRAVDAELGNTRTYKNNQRNYWKANNIIQGYRFKDHDENSPAFSSNDFDHNGYSSLRAHISRLMHDGARFSQIYNLIQEHLEDGLSLREARLAVRNNSVEYKLSRVDDFDSFWYSLSDSDKKLIKDAIAYERYMFPWLKEADDQFTEAMGTAQNYNNFVRRINTPRVFSQGYNPNNYRFNQQLYTGNNYRPPITSRNPFEAYRRGGGHYERNW